MSEYGAATTSLQAERKEAEPSTVQADVDEELDSALDKDLAMAPTPASSANEGTELTKEAPQSVTRDEILRRLKESRGAQTESLPIPEAALGGKFKRLPVGEKSHKKKFVESVNGRRREVLVVTDKQGNTKRKTRWLNPEEVATKSQAAAFGMEVPAELAAKQKALLEQQAADEQHDDDIFAGVGTDYDPLKDINSDSENEEVRPRQENKEKTNSVVKQEARDYFGTSSAAESKDDKLNSLTQDLTILAALKRAAGLRQGEQQGEVGDEGVVDPDQAEKRKQFLAKLKQREREDAEDLDLGFGESRFGDEDDEEGPTWDGDDEGGGKKRKRAPKKRKGDKDNVADLMKVLDGRKKS